MGSAIIRSLSIVNCVVAWCSCNDSGLRAKRTSCNIIIYSVLASGSIRPNIRSNISSRLLGIKFSLFNISSKVSLLEWPRTSFSSVNRAYKNTPSTRSVISCDSREVCSSSRISSFISLIVREQYNRMPDALWSDMESCGNFCRYWEIIGWGRLETQILMENFSLPLLITRL